MLALALSVLTAALAGAAPLTQLQRAHAGANVTYVNAPPAGGLTQLQRAHDGASVAYVNAGGSLVAATGAIGGPLGGRTALVGRARLPVRPATTGTGGVGWLVGAFAVAALAIGSVGFLSTRGRSRDAEMAPVTSIEEAFSGGARPAEQQSGRRAA